MTNPFKKATKAQAKLRVLVEGASGSGKTTAALTLAREFGKTALIDTERGSASLYSDEFSFDAMDLGAPYEPERFVEAIKAAEDAGYEVIVIDGITPEWAGPGGCLEIKDRLGGRFQDWAKVSPRHDKFVQAMLNSKCHIIATCRSKQAYTIDEKTKKVEKAGLDPQQRDGLDYEMTLVFHMNQQHIASATKDRTKLFDGRDSLITAETGQRIKAWLAKGVVAEEKPAVADAVDWKSRARALYQQLGKEKAEPLRVQYGEDFEGLCHALQGLLP